MRKFFLVNENAGEFTERRSGSVDFQHPQLLTNVPRFCRQTHCEDIRIADAGRRAVRRLGLRMTSSNARTRFLPESSETGDVDVFIQLEFRFALLNRFHP